MSVFYLDTSALVKRYTRESGSEWIRKIFHPDSGHTILIAEVTLAEVAAAFAAKSRAPNGITEAQRDQAMGLFRQESDQFFTLLVVDRPVIDRAVELTQKYRLRGYDAIQLATALVTREVLASDNLELSLISSDVDLNAAAESEGLNVENPQDHKNETT